MRDKFLTISEGAKVAGVNVPVFRRMIRNGEIPYTRLTHEPRKHRMVRFSDCDAVNRMLAENLTWEGQDVQ